MMSNGERNNLRLNLATGCYKYLLITYKNISMDIHISTHITYLILTYTHSQLIYIMHQLQLKFDLD